MKDNKGWIAAGLAIGVAVLVLAAKLKPGVEQDSSVDRARAVDVVTLTERQLIPQAQGFGRVAPKLEWQAVSEVSGEVIYRHPDLYPGRLLRQGTELLRIDPLEYELKLAQAQADVSSAEAQLARTEQNQINLNKSLSFEQKRLVLAETETARQERLRKQNLISESALDNQQTALLAQRNVVQELESQLALLPDDLNVARASLKVAEAALNDAKRRLAKTVFVLPFDGRIGEVNIEQAQVVQAGQTLFAASGFKLMEVEAQVAVHEFRTLSAGFGAKLVPGEFRFDDLGLSAVIESESGSWRNQWPAKVTAIRETLDPNQATLGVIVEITQDFSQLDLTKAPPLTKDLFVRTTLNGAPQAVLTVPARAMRQSSLYLLVDGKLKIQPVTILFRSGDWVAVSGEISAGQQVVLNDLIPAIDGMALRAVNDKVESQQ